MKDKYYCRIHHGLKRLPYRKFEPGEQVQFMTKPSRGPQCVLTGTVDFVDVAGNLTIVGGTKNYKCHKDFVTRVGEPAPDNYLISNVCDCEIKD